MELVDNASIGLKLLDVVSMDDIVEAVMDGQFELFDANFRRFNGGLNIAAMFCCLWLDWISWRIS